MVAPSTEGESILLTEEDLQIPDRSRDEGAVDRINEEAPVVFIQVDAPIEKSIPPQGTLDPELAMFFDPEELTVKPLQTARNGENLRPLPTTHELDELRVLNSSQEKPAQRVIDFDIQVESSPSLSQTDHHDEIVEPVIPVDNIEAVMPEWLREFESQHDQENAKPDLVENRQPFTLEESPISPLERLQQFDPSTGDHQAQPDSPNRPQPFSEGEQFEWPIEDEAEYAVDATIMGEGEPEDLAGRPIEEVDEPVEGSITPSIDVVSDQGEPPVLSETSMPSQPAKTTGSLLSFLEQKQEGAADIAKAAEMPFTLVDSEDTAHGEAFIGEPPSSSATGEGNQLPDDFSDFLQKLQTLDETLVEPVQQEELGAEQEADEGSIPAATEPEVESLSEVEKYTKDAADNWERWGYGFESQSVEETGTTTWFETETEEAPPIVREDDLYHPPEISVSQSEDQAAWQAPFTEDIDQILAAAESEGLIISNPTEAGSATTSLEYGGSETESSDDTWRSMFGATEYSPGSKAGKAVLDDVHVQADGTIGGNIRLFFRRMKNWFTSLSRVDKALLGLVVVLIVVAISVGFIQRIQAAPTIPIQTKEPETVLVVNNESFIPVSLELPGGWFFDLSMGEVVDGRWQPKGAEWLAGTELRRVIALPWSSYLEAYIKALQPGDTIKIYMDNEQSLVYKVDRVEQVRADEKDILSGNDLSMIIILSQPESSSRWVVFCKR